MTGQRWDGRYGRGRTGPLQAETPVRLPGGVWGPPPVTGEVSFDANGFPATGFGRLDPLQRSNSLARTEWPIPVRWELQYYLSLTRVSFNPATPVPEVWLAPPGAFRMLGNLTWRIESASAEQSIDLLFGPGMYPFLLASNAVPGFEGLTTFSVVAQQIESQLFEIAGRGDPSLGGSTWRYTASAMIGLTSAGYPA